MSEVHDHPDEGSDHLAARTAGIPGVSSRESSGNPGPDKLGTNDDEVVETVGSPGPNLEGSNEGHLRESSGNPGPDKLGTNEDVVEASSGNPGPNLEGIS